jgi:hypothetical protein
MKSFKDYLTESTRVYEFKVKLAGDYEKAGNLLKSALSQYNVVKCSAGKRLPIAETHADFPGIKNTNVTIFDVSTAYPVNSETVRSAIANTCGCSLDAIRVRTSLEEAEIALNYANSVKSGEALLGKDYNNDNSAQDKVGEKHTMSLLKELNKVKHQGEQVTGTNDQLLAKSTPKGK